MGIFQTIRNFLDDANQRYSDLSQEQSEAFVDALTYAMIVDGEIADVEEDRLADALEEFDWRAETPLTVYVDDALDRAATCVDYRARAKAYFSAIAERLGDDGLQRQVYFLSAKVACADEQILDSERVLLTNLVDAFDIDAKRLELITRELRQSM